MLGWTISDWQTAYNNGDTPATLLPRLLDSLQKDDVAWISLINQPYLDAQLQALEARRKSLPDLSSLPLYGVPFAAKDNIDVGGIRTTAACPEFAYIPTQHATVIQRLLDAGAIVIGKTNLDQFATGLVGIRSPYGAVPNSFDPEYVSGGSSSGSASVVARGLVAFSLGTDTAGSGRVPAGLNNIVGLKPTVGAISGRGVVPACRTLDCVSIFATTVADAELVFQQASGFDEADGYSRARPDHVMTSLPAKPRFGIPAQPEFYGDAQSEQAYAQALARIKETGAECIPLDFSLFDQVTTLLYDGPWVAERYAAIETFAKEHADAIHPVVRDIIFRAKEFSAADTFNAQYKLADLKRQADKILASVDALLVPTAPTHYKISDVAADPIRRNSHMGKYTNFVNLLNWCALAVPANFRSDGLPFGLTLIGPAWSDHALAAFGKQCQALTALPRGATKQPFIAPNASPVISGPAAGHLRLAVVGAHLTGMPLNRELTERHAVLVESTQTSDSYRLYALAQTVPPKPGLARSENGAPIIVELWDIPLAAFGSFVAGVPAPLGIGTLELSDGRQVKGFICEPYALESAQDITAYGGWRAYCNKAA
ncbi:allophanate hydrolase [Herminiimonas arsenitoxidans]|uniref:allophanate hydrolase n=1 Tax=Herminiimonas arsenitoxidans TaxID=1809410 RepID=UPI0009704E6C|nr:allophanate hydrolase [Herminiimonas arsenitoxidans]